MNTLDVVWVRHRNLNQSTLWCAKRFILLLCLLFLPNVQGQVLTGEIDGTVRDSTGAVIGDAEVTITNAGQNLVTRTVKTDSKGQFTAPLLTIGTYIVKVSASGFKTEQIAGLEVHVGQPSTIPVVLSTGAVTEEVSVTASEVAPQLESAARVR